MSRNNANLTIGAVAAETNVSVSVLRAWELRFGFPTPDRLPSGHRRFTARHVEEIRDVLRDRDAGMSLEAAIRRLRSNNGRDEPSIFAGLRRRWPDLPVHVLSRRAMIAISRAIEDECCAQAERPVLIGAFQRERFYRRSEQRWRDLARTASSAIVFADFDKTRRPRNRPAEVALAHDAPLLREWAVVCDAPDAAACVAAFERPGDGHAVEGRRFEAVWSVDPAVVRDAVDIGLSLARRGDPDEPSPTPPRPLTDFAATLRRATAVTNRVVAYLDV